MTSKERLFDRFPPVSTEEWLGKIHNDLKGEDFRERLVWEIGAGTEVNPFYRMKDTEDLLYTDTVPGEFPYLRGTEPGPGRWHVRQDIDVYDYPGANNKALSIINRGVDSLGFIITDPETVSKENLKILLRDIDIGNNEINILSQGKSIEILDILGDVTEERGMEKKMLSGAIETDPLGRLMTRGNLCIPVEKGFDYLASLTGDSSLFPGLCTIHVNGPYFTNAGADIVSQLAFTISMGAEYMVRLTDRGVSPETAASKIRFSFGTGTEYFPEIARLRAARILWSAVIKGFMPDGYRNIRMKIHSVSGRWNKALYDPYNNMLRTQTEAMSAILGGTDSLTVEPYDIVFRTPDEFSERIARNQQLILREEAFFGKVADAAGGSYYIEKLTSMIADNAWKLFLETEERGGFLSSLRSGFIREKVNESARYGKENIAGRKEILLGINHYPDPDETIPADTDMKRLFDNGDLEDDHTVSPLIIGRVAEDYERIRISIRRLSPAPTVFILPFGDINAGRSLEDFTSSFFGCGGIIPIRNKVFDTVVEGMKKALVSKADIIVLCSSEEKYILHKQDIRDSVNDNAIIVAAVSDRNSVMVEEPGIDFIIHGDVNIPASLTEIINRLVTERNLQE